jgi:hypothetical protein
VESYIIIKKRGGINMNEDKLDLILSELGVMKSDIGSLKTEMGLVKSQLDENTQLTKAVYHRQEVADAKLQG